MQTFPLTAIAAVACANMAAAFGPTDLQPAKDVDITTVDPDVAAYLKTQNFTETGNHLWFYWINNQGGYDEKTCRRTGQCRCGDVDAASRMPAELFEPKNFLRLAQYATITVKYYDSLPGASGMITKYTPGVAGLKLGRCKTQTVYTCSGTSEGTGTASWVNVATFTADVLMGPICKKQCGCTYPACPDQPDDPATGKFCSLCGPKYNAPAQISFNTIPTDRDYDDDDGGKDYDECGNYIGQNIYDVLEKNPELSTLRAALTAADLDGALSKPGPWTLFAPTNKAFAELPFGVLKKLLKPENKQQLQDLLTYHVHPDSVYTTGRRPLKNGAVLTTELRGETLKARVIYVNGGGYAPTVLINSAKITTADIRARDSVVHIIDSVLTLP